MSRISTQLFLFVLVSTMSLFATGCNMLAGRSCNSKGVAYFERGDYQSAADEFKRAVAEYPDNVDYVSNYATTMKKLGQVERAQQSYQHALQLDPGHQPSYHGLASLYMETGRPQMASSLIAGWAETQPYSPAAHIEMAWMNRETGNYTAAEESLRSALKINPNHPVALAQLGQVYQDTGRNSQALALYQSSLIGNWHQPEVQNRIAQLNPNPAFQPEIPRTAWSAQPAFGSQGIPQTVMQLPPGATIVEGPILTSPGPQFAADPAHTLELAEEIPAVEAR